MIDYLRISGLGVIAEAELALSPGMVALTGETGAGKTMIMTALDLLFGGRANPGLIRPGSTRAEVEAGIRVQDTAALLGDYDVQLEDGLVLVGRSVGEQRSRGWLAGRGAPASLLAELGDELVVRHGQNDQRRLAVARYRRSLLDTYAGAEHLAAVGRFAESVEHLRSLDAGLAALRTKDREAAQRADLLRHGCAEINAAGLTAGEEQELRNELQRLEHVVELREGLGEAYRLLREDEERSVEAGLAAAEHLLARSALHDGALSPLVEAVGQAQAIVGDTASGVAAHLDGLDADPARLDEVQQRLALLKQLQRKYGDSVAEVLQWAADAASQLHDLDTADERLERLTAERRAAAAEVAAIGLALHETRVAAAATPR